MINQANIKKRVNQELKIFFAKKEKNQKIRQINRSLVAQIKSLSLRGGDKLRPQLVINSFQLLGNKKVTGEVIRLSLSAELFHTACLIHDDLMDKSELRRGGMTIHKYFGDLYQNQELGNSLAVLAGDLALVWADDLFIENMEFFKKTKSVAFKYYSLLREEVIFGQQLDLMLSDHTPFEKLTEAMILQMYEFKTARYSFVRPIQVGGAFAGVDELTLQHLGEFAKLIGVAFQIKDDLLGVFGDMVKTGKGKLDDLLDRKKTLLIYYALKNQKDDELLKLLNQTKITIKDAMTIKYLIEKTDAYNMCEKRAQELVFKAKEIITKLKINSEAKDYYFQMADYAIGRDE